MRRQLALIPVRIVMTIVVLLLLAPPSHTKVVVTQRGTRGVAPIVHKLKETSQVGVVRIINYCGLWIDRRFWYAMYVAIQADCSQLQEMQYIGVKESGWNEYAVNPESSATGIFQFLSGSWCGGNIYSSEDQARCADYYMKSGQTYQTWYKWWN